MNNSELKKYNTMFKEFENKRKKCKSFFEWIKNPKSKENLELYYNMQEESKKYMNTKEEFEKIRKPKKEEKNYLLRLREDQEVRRIAKFGEDKQ